MKVLLVKRIVEYIDPMEIELLSALAKREGHETALAILAQDNVEEVIREVRPDVVAFSALTGEHRYYLKAAEAVKRVSSTIPTVIGGPHCTFFPEIIEDPNIDFVGSGECDNAWPALLKALDSGQNPDRIKNIFTKSNWYGQFRLADFNGRRAHFGNRTTALDELPFLDRELVYARTHLATFPMRSFMSSRGCPFECTYCFEPQFNKLSRLCAELKEAKDRYPTQFIKFYDDMFFVKKAPDDWLMEFAEVYPREVGLPFFCLTRCNVLTEEVLRLLLRAGLHSLTMSIETGNDYVRSNIIKRHMTREEIMHAFGLCNKYGVVTFANTILGIPVRSEIMAEHRMSAIDYDIESLDLNIAAGATYSEFGTAYPYPGCELAEYTEKNGWFSREDFDNLHISYGAESPLNCFSPKEKMMQNNLALLGTVCVAFPWLRNITVNYLIKLPLARLYFIPYYLTKGYLNIFKVYPMKFTLSNLARNIFRSIRFEWTKRSPGKTLYKKPSIRNTTTTQMLGGPPKI